ncbi:MAG: hypothetical protein HFF11_01210 [Angelakisella sp.]|nr:hypothetical protein [Angelakisella sp.]
MRGYSRRRFRPRPHFGGAGSWAGYLQRRKSSIIFLGLFLAGLLTGSIYTVRDSGGEQMILAVVTHHIQEQAQSGYWKILTGCLVSSLGYIVFLYFAANCVQGRWLANLVPVFYGLAVGSKITALLFQHGLGAGWYVLVCILLPRFFQLILLIAACRQTRKLSQSISAQKPAGEQSFLLLGAATVVLSMIESVIIIRFTGLLTYL